MIQQQCNLKMTLKMTLNMYITIASWFFQSFTLENDFENVVNNSERNIFGIFSVFDLWIKKNETVTEPPVDADMVYLF